MVRVFIYACEGVYGGLHGICSSGCYEVENLEVAEEIGCEMAQQVVEDYLYDEEDEDFEPEYEYCIWKIREDINLSMKELDEEAYHHDYKSFVELYCEDKMWEEEE